MAVTVIRNGFNGTTPGAPDLTGAAGSLIAVLDFCLVTTLGWTKEFSGTNTASYRQPVGTSKRMYLGANDPGDAVRLRGYEQATDAGIYDAGIGPFPTAAQGENGVCVKTYYNGSGGWLFVSNGKCFYLFVDVYDYFLFFGDYKSYLPGDEYNVALIGGANASVGAFETLTALNGTAFGGHFLARSYTGVEGSVAAGKSTNATFGQTATLGNHSPVSYPSPIGGGLLLSKVYLHEGNNTGFRGELPGLWSPLHSCPLADKDTYEGTGVLEGRTFEVLGNNRTDYYGWQVHIETSNTWDSY